MAGCERENAERVELEHGRAVGVWLSSAASASASEPSAAALIRARKSVILSAGAVKTPQLLMLSGIGCRRQLAANGVECLHHLPGVGQNLMDHACFSLGFHCDDARHSLSYLGQPQHKLAAGARYLLGLGGPAGSNIWEGGGVVFGNAHADTLSHPNLQYHFAPILAVDKYDGAQMSLESGFQMQIDQLRPHSRGAITLQSDDPRADPRVTFNYFQDSRDMLEMVDGYRTAMELLRQPAFDLYRGQAALSATNETDAGIEHFIRGTSGTDYHPCGTCRMGNSGKSHNYSQLAGYTPLPSLSEDIYTVYGIRYLSLSSSLVDECGQTRLPAPHSRSRVLPFAACRVSR